MPPVANEPVSFYPPSNSNLNLGPIYYPQVPQANAPGKLLEIFRPGGAEFVPSRNIISSYNHNIPLPYPQPVSQFTHSANLNQNLNPNQNQNQNQNSFPSGPARLIHIFRQGTEEIVAPRKAEVQLPPPVVIEPVVEVKPIPKAVEAVKVEPPAPKPITIIPAIPIATRDFKVGGGPFHTNMMSIEPFLPQDGLPHNVVVQWYRADVEDEYYPIPGATLPTYWPTADDLHGNLRVDYSVDGGELQQIEADSDGLTPDPEIARKVQENLNAQRAVFEVQQRKYDGSLVGRVIELTEKSIIIKTKKDDKSFKLKVLYHNNLWVNLSPWEQNVFDIEFNDASRNRPVFICKDILERDVIALTIRSFVNVALKNSGQVALHRVSGLNVVRGTDRKDQRDSKYKQAMLSV